MGLTRTKALVVVAGITFVILVSLAATSRTQRPDIEVLFSRVDDPQAAIIQALDGAEQTVHIALYYFTDPKLADAVVRARARGVAVYVYLDRSQVTQQYSQARYLTAHKVPVRISSNRAIMHNKFAVIDGATVITGSYNWTKSAYQRNDENLLVIRRSDLAARYKRRFAVFWTREFDQAATETVRGD